MHDPFSQEMSDARTSYTGTGLGLSIVKRMLDQMGAVSTALAIPVRGAPSSSPCRSHSIFRRSLRSKKR